MKLEYNNGNNGIPRNWQDAIIPHLIAIFTFSGLAILATWPLLPHIASHLPATPGELGQDVWQNLWNTWWVYEALAVRHTWPYHTDMLFYPQGTSLNLHTLNLPINLIGLPLVPVLGVVVSYNIVTLLAVILVGYSSFLLARSLTNHTSAAIVAGAIVMCSPQRLIEMRGAQLPTFCDYGVPLAILAVLAALKHRTWRMALLAAVMLLLTGLSSWYHFFNLLPVLLVVFLWRMGGAWHAAVRRADNPVALRDELLGWGRLTLMTSLIILPFLLPGAIESLVAPYDTPSMIYNAQLRHLLPRTFGIWQPVGEDWWEPTSFAIIPLMLLMIGFVLTPRSSLLWGIIGLVCFLLSLGTQSFSLNVFGLSLVIPMPYTLLHSLPVVGSFRGPYRFNAITTLMIGVVVSYGLAHIARTYARQNRFWAWGGGMLLHAHCDRIHSIAFFPYPGIRKPDTGCKGFAILHRYCCQRAGSMEYHGIPFWA